jgi:hypothetical protein
MQVYSQPIYPFLTKWSNQRLHFFGSTIVYIFEKCESSQNALRDAIAYSGLGVNQFFFETKAKALPFH